ncbi:hypothetical protein CsSME_00010849 [Camellia sinensis var. sinensis]
MLSLSLSQIIIDLPPSLTVDLPQSHIATAARLCHRFMLWKLKIRKLRSKGSHVEHAHLTNTSNQILQVMNASREYIYK